VIQEFVSVPELQLVRVPAANVEEAVGRYRARPTVLYAEPDTTSRRWISRTIRALANCGACTTRDRQAARLMRTSMRLRRGQ